MCNSSAHLTYGILIRTISLCLAARQWTAVSPTLEGVELIKSRKARGTLETEKEGAVERVPGEVWDMVKREVIAIVGQEVEHAFIFPIHEESAEIWIRNHWPVPPTPNMYTFAHYMSCPVCQGDPQVREVVDEEVDAIDAFLGHFGLDLVDNCFGLEGGDCDPKSVMAVTVQRTHDGLAAASVTSGQIPHGHGDVSTRLVTFSPSFFTLPSNANDCFAAFLSSGLTLETGNFETTDSFADEEREKEGKEMEEKPQDKVLVDSEGEKVSTDEPRWMMWTSCHDSCRYF